MPRGYVARMRRSPETLVVAAIVVALLGVTTWCARRDTSVNQAAYEEAERTGVIPPAPPAVSGATLTIQERL